MNKRTADLFAQALDEAVPETWTTLGPVQLMRLRDKFAELIVRECAIVARNTDLEDVEGAAAAAGAARDQILEHFGVEE